MAAADILRKPLWLEIAPLKVIRAARSSFYRDRKNRPVLLDKVADLHIMKLEGRCCKTVSPQVKQSIYVDRLGTSRAVNTLLGICRP